MNRLLQLRNPLMHGPDVLAIQEALAKAGIFKGPKDGVYGPETAHAAKTAKYRLGYPKSACVPTAGAPLLSYLQGTKKLPRLYTIRRHLRGFGLTRQQKRVIALRTAIVKNARWGKAHTSQIPYTESSVRDNWLFRLPWTLPLDTDCSGFATACYKWSGAPDPNGLGYRELGYTGTMLAHGRVVTRAGAQPGDLMIWGVPPGHHVAVVLEAGADPLLASHGGPGVVEERASVEDRYQGGRPSQVRNYLD